MNNENFNIITQTQFLELIEIITKDLRLKLDIVASDLSFTGTTNYQLRTCLDRNCFKDGDMRLNEIKEFLQLQKYSYKEGSFFLYTAIGRLDMGVMVRNAAESKAEEKTESFKVPSLKSKLIESCFYIDKATFNKMVEEIALKTKVSVIQIKHNEGILLVLKSDLLAYLQDSNTINAIVERYCGRLSIDINSLDFHEITDAIHAWGDLRDINACRISYMPIIFKLT